MLLHWRKDTEITLYSSCVVIVNVVMDHLCEFLLAGKTVSVITFPFENAPKSFHRTIVNAMRHARHALRHSGLHKFVVEGTVGVLKASIAVEQRMCFRIGFHSIVKGLEHQWIIIAFAQYVRHNAPVEEVQNGTQVDFMYLIINTYKQSVINEHYEDNYSLAA